MPAQRVALAPRATAAPRSTMPSTSGTSWPSPRPSAFTGQQKIDGPLFLGMDTHALSVPAAASALEVLAANGVEVMIAAGDEYTPTPAISHAILTYNRGRKTGLADGIVITPSHNPPQRRRLQIQSAERRPGEPAVTDWIEEKANEFLGRQSDGVQAHSLTTGHCGPPRPTATTTSTPTSATSAM